MDSLSTYRGVGKWERKFTSLEEKRGVDPSMKGSAGLWGGSPPAPYITKEKYKKKYSNESPGKGHTSRYEADDEADDGEPKGT